jgi:hypothetical protein
LFSVYPGVKKLFLGVQARLAFLKEEDEWVALDLMRRFSSAPPIALHA